LDVKTERRNRLPEYRGQGSVCARHIDLGLAPLSELSHSGAVAILSKPIRLDRLERALHEAMQQQRLCPKRRLFYKTAGRTASSHSCSGVKTVQLSGVRFKQ